MIYVKYVSDILSFKKLQKLGKIVNNGTSLQGFGLANISHILNYCCLLQVTVEATVEHPFFVFGQGWSSCEPAWTSKRYGLDCQRLSVGDVCISLTHKEVAARAAEISQQQQQQNKLEGCSVFNKDMKAEMLSHTSPARNKSPGHVTSGSFSPPTHSVRSDSRPTHDTSVKDEHLFTPPTSQITLSSPQAQEQKSRPSPTTTAS